MASLQKVAQASGKACSGSVSSLRVRPFTALAKPARQIRARAAAAEAQTDDDFAFSFSDAKKNNDYQASDVEAALRFYQDGEGTQPSFDADFVTNALGMEDASFFDDIDNNEAYADDEYVVAGIPEAAPKRRGRGRREGEAAADEDDDLEQAKSLDKVKAMEDRMVLEAALEENFGDAEDAVAVVDHSTGVWDWLLQDGDSTAQPAQLQEARTATRKRTAAANVTDAEVYADLAVSNNPAVFESAEVRSYLDMFADDGLPDDAMDLVATPDLAGPGPEIPDVVEDESLAKLDALLEEPLPELPTFPAEKATNLPRLEDEPELDRAVVEKYIATLRAALNNTTPVSEEEVEAMFGDALQIESPVPVENDAAEIEELLAAEEPSLPAEDFDLEALTAALEDGDEINDDDDEGLGAELADLAAFGQLSAEDLPTDEQIAVLEAYVASGETYLAQEEERKSQIAAAVVAGQLPADVLAEDLEDVPDAWDEVVAEQLEMEEEDDDSLDVAAEDEDDGETWVERIIELTRVTKVVKGGKIMGFRCTAIVGNQNGLVGVGCQAGREVAVAVKRTLVDAKKNIVRVPLVGAGTIPHKSEAKYHAARAIIVPASDGTGVIAGGSIRSVLELAGVQNVLGKRLGCRSALNNARATVKALQQLKTLNEVSKTRGIPMDELLLPQ